MIVWVSFEGDSLAHDGDRRRLGAGLSFLGGLLGPVRARAARLGRGRQ